MALYSEAPEAGNAYRAAYRKQLNHLVRRERQKADRRRNRFFSPDCSSAEAYTASFKVGRLLVQKPIRTMNPGKRGLICADAIRDFERSLECRI